MLFDGRQITDVVEAAARFVQRAVDAAGKDKKIIIGVSGGIDSAVAYKLATKYVPLHRVIPVAMPYGADPKEATLLTRSSQESVEHAKLLVMVAGKLRISPITKSVDAEIRELVGTGDFDPTHVAWANLKARVRAVRLRTLANLEDGIVLGTENMVEHYLGYFTLGGDEESDFEVLSSFTKGEVRALAETLGVPQPIITKAPSADLWTGQTDEGELGFLYEEADAMIVEYFRHSIRDGGVRPLTVGATARKKIRDRIAATDFKRQQKPSFSIQHMPLVGVEFKR